MIVFHATKKKARGAEGIGLYSLQYFTNPHISLVATIQLHTLQSPLEQITNCSFFLSLQINNVMKLLPIPLSPLGGPPLGMWSSDWLWRYPSAPPSPLAELKTQLPPQLSTDPRLWGREEVVIFLRWTEREFDLPKFELDLFQMNGKAICLLTKNDLAERCPGAGDIIHNVLQLLIRDAQSLHRHLPSSPVTPTSRYPLSPHSHPPTPNWGSLAPPDNPFYANHLQHFMASNSVTLSPAPSMESQAGSPPQNQQETASTVFASNGNAENARSNGEAREGSNSGSDCAGTSSGQAGTSSGSSSHQSDSEEDSSNNYKNKAAKLLPPPITQLHSSTFTHQSPPATPKEEKETKPSLLLQQQQQMHKQLGFEYSQHNLFFNNQNDFSNGNNTSGSSSASPSTPTTPGYMSVKREFFPDTPTEPNTSELQLKYLKAGKCPKIKFYPNQSIKIFCLF